MLRLELEMYLGNNEGKWRVSLKGIETKKTKCYTASNAISFLLTVYAAWTLKKQTKTTTPNKPSQIVPLIPLRPFQFCVCVIHLVLGFGTQKK